MATVEGVDELERNLGKIRESMGRGGLGIGAERGAIQLKRNVQKHIRARGLLMTSAYVKSIEARKLQARLVPSENWAVLSSLIYAAIQEYGATIRARRAPYLVFQVGGQWVRVRQVTIPPRPHWRPAIEESKRLIVKENQNGVLNHMRRVL